MSADKYKPLYSNKLYSPADWHISFLANDKQFKDDVDNVKKLQASSPTNAQKATQGLADKWGISIEDLQLFILPLYLEIRHKTTSTYFDPWTGKGAINFTHKTTRAELLEEWERLEHVQLKVWNMSKTKRKSPAYPLLLYAVFKARKRRDTFPTIFNAYKTGSLTGYSGDKKMFDTVKELEDYYHQHYPKNIPSV